MFDKFVEYLENKNTKEALDILNKHPDILNFKTEDNWSCIQLATYYDNTEILRKILEIATPSQINNFKYHPIQIALDEYNKSSLKVLFDNIEKIDFDLRFKQNDNLIHIALYNGFIDAAKKIHQIDSNLYLEENNSGVNAAVLSLEKKANKLFEEFSKNVSFQEIYDDVYLKKTIQYNSVQNFKNLYHFSNLSSDEIFQIALDFEKPQIISELIEFADFLPGEKQIQSLIDLACKKYETNEENKACGEIINYLFEIKIPFYKFVNQYQQSAWMLSIQNENDYVFKKLAQTNENVNHVDYFDCTPLNYAIEKGNESYVNTLLRKRANPNIKNKNGHNALIQAVQKGNLAIVNAIIPHISNINEFDRNNETALNIAIKQKRMKIVSALIWAGAEISFNPLTDIQQETIYEITSDGRTEQLTYQYDTQIDGFIALSKLGFNLNEKNDDGDYFLHHFIKNGDFSNFKSFLHCQINPNMKNADNDTILMCAAKKNNSNYFSILLSRFKNLDFNHKNNDGISVVDICIQTNSLQKIDALLGMEPALNKENIEKSLCYISRYGKVSKHLDYFSTKVDIKNYFDPYSNNLLMHSIVGGNIDNFKFLIDNISEDLVLLKNKQNKNIYDLIDSIPNPDVQFEFKKIADDFFKKKTLENVDNKKEQFNKYKKNHALDF